jgi:immune inhibitor A
MGEKQNKSLLANEDHQPAHSEICAVAPSPELQEQLRSRFDAIVSSANAGGPQLAAGDGKKSKKKDDGAHLDEMVSMMLRMRSASAPGLNDGLIIPGNYFPLGTPLRTISRVAADRAPLTGNVRVIVVLVNFKDKKMTAAHNQQHFKDLFFSTGVLPNGSVQEYFKEVTGGLVNITGEVVGPFELSQNIAHYAHGESGIGNAQPNARTMAQEAAQLANPTVNFAPYDNDGNGFVDAFIVIHAGSGAEQTGSVNDIWSHKWVLPSQFNADGTKIYAYLTVPEDSRIGVCCHELGHLVFGFPDLYDTDGTSEGVGNWCLMGGGSWNGGGDIPAHPSAWCKANQGWVTTVAQMNNATVSIQDVKTGKKVYRLWKDGAGGNEYFLVENRQKILYDKKLPGDGLLIWHIDESIGGNSNEAHPKVKLMEADGLDQLKKGLNRGDAGDSFPGSANNKTFNNTSTPNSKSYAGVSTCVGVTNIGASAATMSAKLSVKCVVKPSKEFIKEKEIRKEFQKEFKEFKEGKEKEFKEFKEFKEIDKSLQKEVDKPVTDKTAAFDKPRDKFADKLNEGGGFGGGLPTEPFIGGGLRPDLSQGALLAEDTGQESGELHDAESKRLYDSKPTEV